MGKEDLMYTKKIDEVDFEGTVVRPRGGVYRCPYCKGIGDPRYPAKSWKTLKGFQNHMGVCSGKPSSVEKKRLRDIETQKKMEEANIRQAEMNEAAKQSSPVKVGEKVHVCTYYVSKPTHEWRGSRLVHVRYDEVRDYQGRTLEVTGVIADTAGKTMVVAGGKAYYLSDLHPTLVSATMSAYNKQEAYDAGVKESSSYR